ncbi:uncharacterized protein EAF01_006222 [Botrytis porri]|uniref:Uncharacterized protein n=1 Tax=Botrytis porri TaxID=87229 RepID=A0A4Z1K6P1_9HELO|nr:uncharacterized protein EAF01_006222 [Botrytis porri]KAF7903173.1 hypothetical protein EAF01_006222 [Botrytis porri]TGO81615.1 hypothetical protein BPOR_1082g00040 [Botrytis porri]
MQAAQPNNDTDGPDNTKKDALAQAFEDMVYIVNQGLNSNTATHNTIFDKYFLPEHKDAVKKPPMIPRVSTGADISSAIDVHPEDHLVTMIKQCSGLNPNKKPLAYTNQQIDRRTTNTNALLRYQCYDAYACIPKI